MAIKMGELVKAWYNEPIADGDERVGARETIESSRLSREFHMVQDRHYYAPRAA
jgi:hypothetical protein